MTPRWGWTPGGDGNLAEWQHLTQRRLLAVVLSSVHMCSQHADPYRSRLPLLALARSGSTMS